MPEHWEIYDDWNPRFSCTKISPGCKYCYVYRQDEMYGSEISSSECRKMSNFNLPLKSKRDKSWKIENSKLAFSCFTSYFLLKDADKGSLIRWAVAYALSRIVVLDRYAKSDLYDRLVTVCDRDEDNGIKNQYLISQNKAAKIRKQ